MSSVEYIGNSCLNLLLLPFNIAGNAVNATCTVVGVASSVLSVGTFGQIQTVNNFADLTRHAYSIVPNVYKSVLEVVNPYSRCEEGKRGILTESIATPIFKKAKAWAEIDFVDQAFYPINTFLKKQVLSRGAYVLGALVATITRTADLALGLVAAVFSVIPFLGRARSLNNFAMRNLTFLGVIHDVCKGIRGFVNPQQFVREQR